MITNHAKLRWIHNVEFYKELRMHSCLKWISVPLGFFCGVTLMLACDLTAQQPPSHSHTAPAAELLQSGDFLWPKQPGAIVPYNSKAGHAGEDERQAWEKARAQYLDALKSQKQLTPLEKQRLQALKDMNYDQFLAVYLAGASPTDAAEYGGHFGVGHVAIVRIKDSTITIVEAMIGKGVRELSYEDWKKDRGDDWIWHARLTGVSDDSRAAIGERAASQVKKPYRFWNFDLADESGFYCSKLAWWSVKQATGVILDDRPDPKRLLWYSPKQMLGSVHLQVLQDPGSYFH